ncbi:hypothetical protein [Pseudoalteromonas denitrificans]|uniref:Uncharacterized protein n=1 Tax=Pseudoalteromonas denitrificans DSM 6059 TaxID=1123010 RepID=A0A1I1M7V6_9GAMM|nr:hypothetical protein [Pseudoalteromonas denitrificans]SFC77750.1 hypothetical protein SAMN02745724_02509 [Pseudoalteromonas denitrificans DSM 6059]
MFGKLKAAAGDAATSKATKILEPHIQPVLEKMRTLSPASISHNESYQSKVITPAKIAVLAATSGLSKLIPQFDEKFNHCMFHLRNELVDVSGDTVKLVPNFKEALPQALKEGLTPVNSNA